jgi:predicted CxxxxCH...CXXCH cytochrome family protein
MNKFTTITKNEDTCKCCHGNKPGNTHPENPAVDFASIDTSSPVYWNGGTFSIGTTVGKVSTADDSCSNVACHSTTGKRNWDGPSGPLACDTCHEYPGSGTNDWTGTNGHTIRYTPGVVGTYNSNLNVTHLNVASAYNAATDTYEGVTSDVNKCGKCHPNISGNHKDGYIEVAPNGYGAGGGNFGITKVSDTAVQCSNVACHFSRKTPNWY